MNASEKYVLTLGMVVVVIGAVCFGMAVVSNDRKEPVAKPEPVKIVQPKTASTVQTHHSLFADRPIAAPVKRVERETPVAAPAPTPAGVTPKDLEKLAIVVDLSEDVGSNFKKEQWEKAIPMAEQMLERTVDCGQRNWLNQFVATGNYAVSGSAEYFRSAKLLSTLYRNNQELVTGVPQTDR